MLGRFHPGSLDTALEPPDDDLQQIVYERYSESDRFYIDALDYVSVAADVPADVLQVIADWYANTDRCARTVEDICDGKDEL